MSVTAFIRRCLDAGMPIEMALAAGEAFEEQAPVFVPSDHTRKEKQRARQARYADRKRQKTSENVSLTSGASEGVSETSDDAKEAPPAPPKKNTPIPPLKGGTFPKDPASPEKPKLKPIGAWVAEIWEITPRPGRERSGRKALETALKAAAAAGHDLAQIKTGLIGYYASPDATKSGGEYAKGVDTAIRAGRWEAFAEDEPPPPSDDDPWPRRLTQWRIANYWNIEWGPKPGKPGYRGPGLEERAA